MRSTWTLTVERLGRIERADVEVRPLTLFVGENNTGKSYLASLLWDFHARMPEVFDVDDLERSMLAGSIEYEACRRWLTDRLSRAGATTLTDQDIGLLLSWFNKRLAEGKNAAAERIFGRPGMSIGAIRVRDLALDAPFSITFRHLRRGPAGDVTYTARGYTPGQPRTLDVDLAPIEASSSPDLGILITLVAQLLSPHRAIGSLPGDYIEGDPVYLPASRSGFMLLYKGVFASLIERGMGMTGSNGPAGAMRAPASSVQLTVPVRHFLQMFTLRLKADRRGPFAAEADLLERHAFPGTVALGGGVGVPDVEYRFDPAQPPLPMQLSSSLVTELAPLILVLRHASALPFLVLEEPESHLHPRLVRLIARVIARLVRKGVQVCVTTHSADFCQQINNFIKLGSLSPEVRARHQAEDGYEEQDYLGEGEVAGYQFRTGEHGRSTVARLEGSPSGLAMPTFNEELLSLSRQTLALQRAVEGDG